jgi:crotonobetainyl-CoA:carnitine CoA-transferase CaiB-like acyl-CoA transferase
VYDVFTVNGGEQIFLSAVSDAQWTTLCRVMDWPDLAADPRLASNTERVKNRDAMLPMLRERFAPFAAAELASRFEAAGLPYAPIRRPEELYDDPHLQATGGLVDIRLTDGERAGQTAGAALLPISLHGERLGLRQHPPHMGEHTDAILRGLGRDEAEIAQLRAAQVIA